MSPSKADKPWQPRKHDDPDRLLNPFERTSAPERALDEHSEPEQLDELEDPQDPPNPSEASDPETVANANALK
jgi:hypothetical protein